jgi:hypothetical protein
MSAKKNYFGKMREIGSDRGAMKASLAKSEHRAMLDKRTP